MMTRLSIILVVGMVLEAGVLCGAGFEKAEVTKVQQKVTIFKEKQQKERAARVKDIIEGKDRVQTGAKSRAELVFEDDTLARLGAHTVFSFKGGTRQMFLKKGSMLFQKRKDREELEVVTASVTAAVVGTTGLARMKPGKFFRLIVLEGTARIFLNDQPKKSRKVTGGKMITIPDGAEDLPEPVDIDVRKIFETAGLIQDIPGGTKSLRLKGIKKVIAQQDKLKEDGKLLEDGEDFSPAKDVLDTTKRAAEANPQNPNNQSTQTQGGSGGGSYRVGN